MKALIVTTDGFEDSELTYPYYRLQEAGLDVALATPDSESVTGKIGEEMDADLAISDASEDEYDLLVVPGGHAPEDLRLEAEEAVDLVREFDDAGKPIASVCHGAQLLISADVLEGREVTGYWSIRVDIENAGATFRDEECVVDENLITARYPDDLPAWLSAVLERVEVQPAAAD
ncbi:type 1 glutamine amidotransferase domain-containing protein [Halalkalicoccus sp. NIPERK01]|uniref:type 1 glutamine amidotransferase domain-containing protein n=1 Tax=Halalkalicoccus sp. NIPERK01 TaxID=3053469 RepID=UPI00256EB976|nr:type 1 glutamine amidotransferase domain-containing protein [Halalkalicoccus sp. NIPERK01]MDL5361891.1 type 1 glutamine amidotransferase domain-containing protein [Halalkalicoccus sp. NIPERK01]